MSAQSDSDDSPIEELTSAPDFTADLTSNPCAFATIQFSPHSQSRCTLSACDLDCLKAGEWINEEILNSYLSLLSAQSQKPVGVTNSHFYNKLVRDGPEAASCWPEIGEMLTGHFLRFLIPICINTHWILGKLDFQKRQLSILDSLNRKYDDVARQLNDFLKFGNLEPLEVCYPKVAKQRNSWDCGVFLMMFARSIFLGGALKKVTQSEMSAARKMIREKLREASALEGHAGPPTRPIPPQQPSSHAKGRKRAGRSVAQEATERSPTSKVGCRFSDHVINALHARQTPEKPFVSVTAITRDIFDYTSFTRLLEMPAIKRLVLMAIQGLVQDKVLRQKKGSVAFMKTGQLGEEEGRKRKHLRKMVSPMKKNKNRARVASRQ
jgi:hypothetical protein